MSRHFRFRPAITTQRHYVVRYSQTVRPHQDEEYYVKRMRSDYEELREELKPRDKAHLQLTYEAYDKIETWVRQNTPDDAPPAVRLATAGPRDYINTSNSSGRGTRQELLLKLAEVKLHLKDLQTEPYREYDFDLGKITLSDTELHELETEIVDDTNRLKRGVETATKYIKIMDEGSRRKEGDSRFDLEEFWNAEVARIKSEEGGVIFPEKQQRPEWGPRKKKVVLQPDQVPKVVLQPDQLPKVVRQLHPGEKRLVLETDQRPSTPRQSRIRKIEKKRLVPEPAQKPVTPKKGREGALKGNESEKSPKGNEREKSNPKQADQLDDFSDFPYPEVTDFTDHETLLEKDMKRR